MDFPTLIREGLCSDCDQWLDISGTDYLPTHSIPDTDKKCRSSRYSPMKRRYVVHDQETALVLAQFIMDDNTTCLDSICGTHAHTLNCGDGDMCAQTRKELAQALAQYVLTTSSVSQKAS